MSVKAASGCSSGVPSIAWLRNDCFGQPAVEVRVDGRRLIAAVKLELGRADAHVMAVVEHGVVNLLIVDERAVATLGVAMCHARSLA